MVHYNDIKEGQTVKYYGQPCVVEEKTQGDDGYYITMQQPNPLMIEIHHNDYSRDGIFKNISL